MLPRGITPTLDCAFVGKTALALEIQLDPFTTTKPTD
jgi:hypothetical protein